VNPVITYKSDEIDSVWEGCLSIPGIKAVVYRPKTIGISGYNEDEQFVQQMVTHYHARNLQHEIDHLDGITFLDRDYKYISTKSELLNGILELASAETIQMGDTP